MNQNRSIEELLDTIGDEYARQILASLDSQSRSAKEIAEVCDISLPTVYRRLEALEEQELVTSRSETDDSGNEFRCYECTFESTVISLEGDEYDVRIYRRDNLPDRFSQLWDDLQVE